MDIKTLCLGILTYGDASGYEIKKAFEDAFSHFYVAGFGSIYPALADLARDGYVTVSNIEQEKRPAKKVYSLTDSGRDTFLQSLGETHPHHKVRSDFLVLMVFAQMLSPEQLDKVFDTRLADIERQIGEIQACIDDDSCAGGMPPGVHFTAGFGIAVLESARDYINKHREELTQELTKQQGTTS